MDKKSMRNYWDNFMDYMKSNCKNNCILDGCILPILILVLLGILIIGGYLFAMVLNNGKDEADKYDPFNRALNIVPGARTSFWSLSHFITYLLLGFFFPKCDIIILIGVLWEIIEELLGNLLPEIERIKEDGTIERVRWWQGGTDDIIINTLGFYVGKFVRLRLCCR